MFASLAGFTCINACSCRNLLGGETLAYGQTFKTGNMPLKSDRGPARESASALVYCMYSAQSKMRFVKRTALLLSLGDVHRTCHFPHGRSQELVTGPGTSTD